MDDRRLQVFLTTVRTGSFNKAAQELNCTQSAVTQMMNGIESELGCKLLQRGHNGVKLTPEGEELLPAIAEADASLTRLRQQAQRIAAQRMVPVRLGAFSSIASTWLSRAIKAFQDQHPHIAFDIRIGTDVLLSWLRSGEIDLALGDQERCGDFQWIPLMDDPYYAVMPESLAQGRAAITQKELALLPFIMAPMNALEAYLSELPEKSINVNCDDDSTLISMVAQGLGVTAMPKLCLQNVPGSVSVLELVPPVKRVIGVATVGKPGKEAQKFIDFLTDYEVSL